MFNYTRFQARKYREEAGDGGEAGGGTGGESGSAEGGAAGIDPDLAAKLAEAETLKQENERLQAKITEANKHKKEAERLAKEEARQKAEAAGNHEELYKSAMTELEKERAEHAALQSQINNEKRDNAALKIASELAEGVNVELLADFISRRLKFADGSIKVTDETGNLTVSTLDDLKKEFSGSARYSSLIKGNQSSGGGAAGGSGSSGAAKEITRSEFDALDPVARSKFTKEGGKIVDA